MSIRRSLALSFLLILLLFGINLAGYTWANARRSESLAELRRATTRASLVVMLGRQIDDRERESSLLAQLALDMGSTGLTPDQLAAVRNRLDGVDKRIAQLVEQSEPAVKAQVTEIEQAYQPLRAAWVELYDTIASGTLDAGAVGAGPGADGVPPPGDGPQSVPFVASDGDPGAPVPSEPNGAANRVAAVMQRAEESNAAIDTLLRNLQAEDERRIEAAATHSLEVERITNQASFGIFALTMLVGGTVAWRLSRRIHRGLTVLKEGAGRLGAGNLGHRIPVKSKDEFGTLGEAFNSMAVRLQSAREELVRNQEHLAAELAEAAAYVRSLLPEPLDGDVSSHWRFIPSTQLGGDAFGHEWLDDDHMVIFLLDVCGHGVGSAMLSISVMTVLRSQTLRDVDFHDPGSVLSGLNDAFPMEEHSGRFFTIWYGVYQKSTRELRYASAGHPPAVLIEDLGTAVPRITELGTKGMIIGVLPGVAFTTAVHRLEHRSYLYLFSDGIYEVSNSNGATIPFPQFVACLAEASSKKPSSLDSTLTHVRRLARKDNFEDDVSIVEVVFG